MSEDDGRKSAVSQILNLHGFPFHHAVLRHATRLSQQSKSVWLYEAIEVAVATRGHGTRIDFILDSPTREYWIIAECKRVNPALNEWVFFRAPQVLREEN